MSNAPEVALRLRLFFSSYAPLFAVLAIRFEERALSAACALLAAAGFLTTWLLLRGSRSLSAGSYRVQRAEDNGAAVAAYLTAYLLPFVAVAQPTGRDIAGYLAFLVVAAVVHVRSDMVDVNPTLLFFGYRLFRVTTESGWSAHLLARHDVTVGTPLRAARIRDRLLVLRDDGGPGGGDRDAVGGG